MNNSIIFAQSSHYRLDNIKDPHFHEVENLEKYPEISTNKLQQYDHVFPKTVFSKKRKSELTAKKVLKVILPVLLAAGCVLQQNNVTILIGETFKAFLGYKGCIPPTIMISSYLALKCMLFLEQKPEDLKNSNYSRIFTWLKKVPTNFAIGVSKLPQSLMVSISTFIIADLIFKSLSIDASVSADYQTALNQVSLFKVAVKAPFLEELFFREFVQGSLVSTMKLINLVGSRMGKGITIADKTINTYSRVFSAATFGFLHANQSLTQAAATGIGSYCYETWLYENNGLFASFGLHSANNFFAYLMTKK